MEFGVTVHNKVLYVADMPGQSSEDFQEFRSRVNVWLEIHGIVLGEGTVDVLTDPDSNDGDLPCYIFKLIAPQVEGPTGFTDRISD